MKAKTIASSMSTQSEQETRSIVSNIESLYSIDEREQSIPYQKLKNKASQLKQSTEITFLKGELERMKYSSILVLEEKLRKYEIEIMKLRQRNDEYREKITVVEQENKRLRSMSSFSSLSVVSSIASQDHHKKLNDELQQHENTSISNRSKTRVRNKLRQYDNSSDNNQSIDPTVELRSTDRNSPDSQHAIIDHKSIELQKLIHLIEAKDKTIYELSNEIKKLSLEIENFQNEATLNLKSEPDINESTIETVQQIVESKDDIETMSAKPGMSTTKWLLWMAFLMISFKIIIMPLFRIFIRLLFLGVRYLVHKLYA